MNPMTKDTGKYKKGHFSLSRADKLLNREPPANYPVEIMTDLYLLIRCCHKNKSFKMA